MTYKRADDNQTQIVARFRKLGVSVLILSSVGKGCPDLLISMGLANGDSWTGLVEVKDGKQPPSKKRLTKHEANFFAAWPGDKFIIEDVAGVDALVDKIYSRWK